MAADGAEESDRKGRIWSETKIIWRVTFPAILGRVTGFGIPVVTQIFIGHISELDLAAYGLITSVLLLFFNGILLGMSSATETLCGQAFGACQYHMLGIYLQRSWIVDFVTATILLPLFFFIAPIFKLLGQNDEVATAAGEIATWFIPIIYAFVFSLTSQMYLQSQLRNRIVGWLCSGSFVLHLLLSWIFVVKLDLGVPGAMSVLSISSWSTPIGCLIYIFGGWCPDTWRGFSRAAFTDLFPIIKLSISSGIMLCLELWYTAIIVLLAGYMKNATVAISAFSLCININTWVFMISLGFLTAACVRVSNELGRGNAKAAAFSIKVILAYSVSIGLFFWILFLAFGHQIAHLFTTDAEVAEALSSLSVLLAFSMLLNSVQPVLTGVAVGAGLQGLVAVINACSYYIIGLPVGILLAYVANLEIQGLWMGLLSGVLVQTLVLAFLTWRTNWEDQVNEAEKRLNKWLLEPSSEEPSQSSITTDV